MKYTKYLLALVVAFALCIPVGLSARGSDDAEESPEVSGSETPNGSESPDVSVSRSPSVSPDDDDDEVDVEVKSSSTPTPKAQETLRPTKTPKVEDELEDEIEDESDDSGRPEKTPKVSVPPELEDDVDELLEEDDAVTEVEIDEDEGRVEVKYRLRAKLFGFIDVPYELDARVEVKDGERNVKAKGPWWLIFARDNAGAVQTALESDETIGEATNQGTVLSTIIGILKGLAR